MNQENETIQPLQDTEWLAKLMGVRKDTIEKNRSCFPELLPPHYVIFGRTVRYPVRETIQWMKAREESVKTKQTRSKAKSGH